MSHSMVRMYVAPSAAPPTPVGEMREIWLMTKRWTTLSGKPEMGGGKVEAE